MVTTSRLAERSPAATPQETLGCARRLIATPPRGNGCRRAHHRFAGLGSGSSQSLIVMSILCSNAAALRCVCAFALEVHRNIGHCRFYRREDLSNLFASPPEWSTNPTGFQGIRRLSNEGSPQKIEKSLKLISSVGSTLQQMQ
jgi:hypothetical protein